MREISLRGCDRVTDGPEMFTDGGEVVTRPWLMVVLPAPMVMSPPRFVLVVSGVCVSLYCTPASAVPVTRGR